MTKQRTMNMFAETSEDLPIISGMALTQAAEFALPAIYRVYTGNRYTQPLSTKGETLMYTSNESLTETFNLMYNNAPLTPEEEANAAEYDKAQAAKRAEVQAALNRFIAGTNDLNDALLLEKNGLVVATYGASDNERPAGFRLRRTDGNEYTDQAGLEEKPGQSRHD